MRRSLFAAALALVATAARAQDTPANAPDAPRPEARPFHGLLDKARDRSPAEDVDATEPYRTLLWNLRRITPQEIARDATRVSAAELVKNPEKHRGRLVRVTGLLLAEPGPRRLPGNEAGIETAWRGFALDLEAPAESSDEAWAFDAFERPATLPGREEPVQVEGVFLQLVSYETRSGATRTVPLVLAKSISPVTGERADTLPNDHGRLLAVALGLVALPFVGLAFGRVGRTAPVVRGRPSGRLAR